MSPPKSIEFRRRWPTTAVVAAVVLTAMANSAAANPQTNLLNKGCSLYNATNLSNFYSNVNNTFSDLRSQLQEANTKFATAEQAIGSDPVYAMAQCRDYLSTADCVACFDTAAVQIRNCTGANGARVIYDGCFLRYESSTLYDQTTLPGNVGICGNDTASQPTAFQTAAQGLLTDLETATPRINGYFAAAMRAVAGGGTVYAVAQCAQTVSRSGCLGCLQVAYGNIQSCPPDADGRAVDAGCFLRYSAAAFFGANQTTNITPFLRGGSRNKNAIIGGIVGGGGCLLLIIGLILWYHYHQSRYAAPRASKTIGASELQGPKNFSYRDLKSATKNFNKENKLGEGGFGDIYKGTLKNGNIVAVKKLVMGTSRVKADFVTEVKLISNVHHRNLLRLLGCSSKGPELLLVYDYMGNGSLDKYLYGELRGTLNWKQRFDIIFGTARGLSYLHDQFHVTIIHRDIKSSNILLDDEFQPKIADFGLARLLPDGQSHLSTNFAGTLGYTAPEYAIHGQLTEKVDTYCFGVVVLEIISGRRCNDFNAVEAKPVTDFLLEQAWKLYDDGMHLKLVDEILRGSNGYTDKAAKKIIEIALMCTQMPASSRPTMSEVVMLLSNRPTDLMRPARRDFMDNDNRVPDDTSTTTGSSTSNAAASFTENNGR
ncbi:cysteine-rich receptor-like protein kinase 43 [Rhododendron vialii]|uniref:cysteine-rich receptor-like protein kinase 43 n=1 Tax=Rhododendron vialii TaxID=182163 RepID=UPI00265DE39A|nr:cysteine-rich receptor-like protein kinase 43 [Rhododendron vialii]XP_058185407.1 cysteine-rich receptor-like protein kinase 43 [Rhododendron vialii]